MLGVCKRQTNGCDTIYTLLLVSVTLPEGDDIPVHLPEMERDVETQC